MVSISQLYNDFRSPMGQNHYTKTESDNKYATISSLNGKADTTHTHITSNIYTDSTKTTTLNSKLTSIENSIATLQENDVTFSFVASLPATGVENVIYFVANSSSSSGNRFDEYIWNSSNNEFEKIGVMNIDLSDYVKKSDIDLSFNSSTGILTFSY